MIAVAIKTIFIAICLAIASAVLYAIEGDICELIDFLGEIFDMFAGLKNVRYTPTEMELQYKGGELVQQEVAGSTAVEVPLVSAIFNNSTIGNIYWQMALIGIVLVFAFAIVAVVRKMFDMGDQMKQTLGRILSNSFKAIILIISMNVILTFSLQASQVLLTSFTEAFASGNGEAEVKIVFTESQFGAMARCLNTISNYSLNKSYNSRYNLNACYNDLVEDLTFLKKENVFKYPYKVTVAIYPGQVDKNGELVTGDKIYQTIGEDSWQSVLSAIASAGPIAQVSIDSYNELRNEAILDAMDQIRNNPELKPLESYSYKRVSGNSTGYDMGRLIMLIGSIGAARDSQYNRNMSFMDELRKPYLYGEKDIYSKTEADGDFDYGLAVWHHLLVILISIAFLKQYLGMIFSAAARVFNMVFLYLISPPFIAMMPMDDGERAKQWTMAFVVQTISLFGTVLAMRLFCILIPIVIQNNIVFFPGDSGDQMKTQVCFILACSMVLRKASGLITGILTGNGAGASLGAADMMSEGSETMGKMVGAVRKFSSMGFNMVKQGVSAGADKLQKQADDGAKAAMTGGGGAAGGAGGAAKGGAAKGGGGGGGGDDAFDPKNDPTRKFAEGAFEMVDDALSEGVSFAMDMATGTNTGGIKTFGSMKKKDDDDAATKQAGDGKDGKDGQKQGGKDAQKKQGSGSGNVGGANAGGGANDSGDGGEPVGEPGQDPLGRHGAVPEGAFKLSPNAPKKQPKPGLGSRIAGGFRTVAGYMAGGYMGAWPEWANHATKDNTYVSKSGEANAPEMPDASAQQPEQGQQSGQGQQPQGKKIPSSVAGLANGNQLNVGAILATLQQAVNTANVNTGHKGGGGAEGAPGSGNVSVNVSVTKAASGSGSNNGSDQKQSENPKINADAIQSQISNAVGSEGSNNISNEAPDNKKASGGSGKNKGANVGGSGSNAAPDNNNADDNVGGINNISNAAPGNNVSGGGVGGSGASGSNPAVGSSNNINIRNAAPVSNPPVGGNQNIRNEAPNKNPAAGGIGSVDRAASGSNPAIGGAENARNAALGNNTVATGKNKNIADYGLNYYSPDSLKPPMNVTILNSGQDDQKNNRQDARQNGPSTNLNQNQQNNQQENGDDQLRVENQHQNQNQ